MSVGGRLVVDMNDRTTIESRGPQEPTESHSQRCLGPSACLLHPLPTAWSSTTLEIHHRGQKSKGSGVGLSHQRSGPPTAAGRYVKSFRVLEKKRVGWGASKFFFF